MADNRPSDWDWVTAADECQAVKMFVRLRQLAQRDVATRNEQLSRLSFALTEVSGTEFYVSKDAGQNDRVSFKVADDLATISVRNRTGETIYSVELDGAGVCKFSSGDQLFDFWQVLTAALGSLMFLGRR